MIRYSHVHLHTLAYALPPRVLTSEEIEERLAPLYTRLKLAPGRLELMSGIRERRLWEPGTRPSEAASLAGRRALDAAGVEARDVQSLFFTSVSRDMMEPATASFVHERLGLAQNCLIFDISNACLGFLDGMVMLANMIELGQVESGLVVSGETAEELIDSTIASLVQNNGLTRKTIKPAFASLTIGSGSMALYMERCEEKKQGLRLVHGAWQANTQYVDLCHGGQERQGTLMETNSEELLRRGVETAEATWCTFCERPGWRAGEIDRFFCHQVGSAHARLLFDTLRLESEKNYQTLEKMGNVGSVSAPLTMAMAMENRQFLPGEKGALLGIGSGINCMMLGVEWVGENS